MFTKILSLLLLLYLTLYLIIMFPLFFLFWMLVLIRLDKRGYLIHRLAIVWGVSGTTFMPTWNIKVEGLEKINKGKQYIIIANHQSMIDILMGFHLRTHYSFVAKAELFSVPFMGWIMSWAGYIKIRRGFIGSINQMMKDCEKRLDNNTSLFLFPEGTRSADGTIKDFKGGAFILAQNKQLSILPVVLYGTHDALPKERFQSKGRHKIRMKVFNEVPYEEIQHMSADEAAKMMQEKMVKWHSLIKQRVEMGRF